MAGGNRYIGARPNTDASLADKKWVDDRWTANAITTKYITDAAKVEAASTTEDSSPMVDKAYIDGRDALIMKKTEVDTADSQRVHWSEVGRPNGPIPLDTNNQVPVYIGYSAVLKTERVAAATNAGAVFLTGDTDVTQSAVKSYRAATLTVPYPGFPYTILAFASVLGQSTATAHGPRRTGGGSYGRLAIMTDADLVLSGGMATGSFDWQWAHAVPYGAMNSVAGNTTVFTGSTNLNLWLSLWSGTSYKFTASAATPVTFWALAVPAL